MSAAHAGFASASVWPVAARRARTTGSVQVARGIAPQNVGRGASTGMHDGDPRAFAAPDIEVTGCRDRSTEGGSTIRVVHFPIDRPGNVGLTLRGAETGSR